MKRFFAIMLSALLLLAAVPYAANEVYLDAVTGLVPPNGLPVDQNVVFHFRYVYDGGLSGNMLGSTNGFRLYSPSASWNTFSGAMVSSAWTSAFGYGTWTALNPPSGTAHLTGADTVGFTGIDQGSGGLGSPFNEITFTITAYFPSSEAGKLVAIDTAWYNNCGDWIWTYDGWSGIAPTWGGGPFASYYNISGLDGYVFSIGGSTGCCVGMTGDINNEGGDTPNIADVTYIVAYSFKGGPEPPCIDEADVNGDLSLDIADVTYLVKYAFKGGPAPVACP